MPSKHGLSKADEEGRRKLGHATIMVAHLVPQDIRHVFSSDIQSDGTATERAHHCTNLASSLQDAIGNCMTSPFQDPKETKIQRSTHKSLSEIPDEGHYVHKQMHQVPASFSQSPGTRHCFI
jgi:hypothetical protein